MPLAQVLFPRCVCRPICANMLGGPATSRGRKDNDERQAMKYDPSLRSLMFPETTPPLFKSSRVYNRDMVAVEAARLAYFKFEKDQQSRQIIESALAIVGFDH